MLSWKRVCIGVAPALIGCSDNGGTGGPNHHLPEAGGLCGQTSCSGTQTCCSGRCTDTASDVANCGSCGHVCTGADGCAMGQCSCAGGAACSSTQVCCPGSGCKDTQSDAMNCGSCGHACDTNSGQFCFNSQCCTDIGNCLGFDGGFPFPDANLSIPDGGAAN